MFQLRARSADAAGTQGNLAGAENNTEDEDPTVATRFSSLETIQEATHRIRSLSQLPASQLLGYLCTKEGQTEVKDAIQIPVLSFRRLAVAGFGRILLELWITVTASELTVYDIERSGDVRGGNDWNIPHDLILSLEHTLRDRGSSATDVRRMREDFIDFCVDIFKAIAEMCIVSAAVGQDSLPLAESGNIGAFGPELLSQDQRDYPLACELNDKMGIVQASSEVITELIKRANNELGVGDDSAVDSGGDGIIREYPSHRFVRANIFQSA
jgi:hypothetical protein